MRIPKEYFQDRLALAISIASLVVLIATILTIIFRLGGNDSFIIGYRQNLGIEAFNSGGVFGIVDFLIFSVVVFAAQLLLAWRVYVIDRFLSICVLSAGLVLLLFSLIVSNSLLALH